MMGSCSKLADVYYGNETDYLIRCSKCGLFTSEKRDLMNVGSGLL